MQDTITITGVVGTTPKSFTTGAGVMITSFRLASGQRRLDRSTGEWTDGPTNWYAISAFRRLAANAFASLRVGDHVVLTGRLKVQSWENEKGKGTNVEIDADAIGHDLTWGTSTYLRSSSARSADAAGESGDAAGTDHTDTDLEQNGWSTQTPGSPSGGSFLPKADREAAIHS
jgi:single-strand DNA-binding protein